MDLYKKKNSKQKGYAAVLTLVLFSALSLSLFAMFNSGQIVTHKLKLQNAVDSATYSAVNVVAREMNYMAYTNRAMVANQVTIGQLVGLSSWSKQMRELSGTLDKVGRFVTYLSLGSVPLDRITNAIKKLVEAGDKIAQAMIKFSIPVEQLGIQALSKSQTLVHSATSVMFSKTFPKVLDDNNQPKLTADDSIKALLIPELALASKTSQNLVGVTGYDSLKQVNVPSPPSTGLGGSGQPPKSLADFNSFGQLIRNSDDGFVGTSNYDKGRSYKLNNLSVNLVVVDINTEKKGGNKFESKIQDNEYTWEWSALDTMSFYYEWGCFWCDKHEIALGWGAAHATENPSSYNYYDGATKTLSRVEKNEVKELAKEISLIEENVQKKEKQLTEIISSNNYDETKKEDRDRVKSLNDTIDHLNNQISSKQSRIDYISTVDSVNNYWFSQNISRGWGNARENRKSAKKAISNYKSNKVNKITHFTSSKFNSFYKFDSGLTKDIKGSSFLAVVSKDSNGVRTHNKMMEKNGSNSSDLANSPLNIEANGNMQNDKMYAVSKAQVYFARSFENAVITKNHSIQKAWQSLDFSRKNDSQIEYANLFNPYWQVRLVEYDDKKVALAKGVLDAQ